PRSRGRRFGDQNRLLSTECARVPGRSIARPLLVLALSTNGLRSRRGSHRRTALEAPSRLARAEGKYGGAAVAVFRHAPRGAESRAAPPRAAGGYASRVDRCALLQDHDAVVAEPIPDSIAPLRTASRRRIPREPHGVGALAQAGWQPSGALSRL